MPTPFYKAITHSEESQIYSQSTSISKKSWRWTPMPPPPVIHILTLNYAHGPACWMVCEHELWHVSKHKLYWRQMVSDSHPKHFIFSGVNPKNQSNNDKVLFRFTLKTLHFQKKTGGEPHGHVPSTSDTFIDPKWSQIHSENTSFSIFLAGVTPIYGHQTVIQY